MTTDVTTSDVHETLNDLQELFSKEERWTTRYYARASQKGISCRVEAPQASCFCLIGGINKVAKATEQNTAVLVAFATEEALAKAFNQNDRDRFGNSLIAFNDWPDRTIDEVRALIDNAIKRTAP